MIRDSEQPFDWRANAPACSLQAVAASWPAPRAVVMSGLAVVTLGVALTAGAAAGTVAAAPNVSSAAISINGTNAVANSANTNNSSNVVTAAAAEAPRHWAADTSNGCKIWSPEPIANEVSVRWSGRCENGLAQGPGTVRWLSNNKQVAELTGTMEQGKVRGPTTGVEEPGNRFDGMFIDSLPEGEGKASYADGSTYTGEWHRGLQLGYGIMTFPPAHPQYQDMLNNGKGVRMDNGVYVMRGWWEGKTFVTPCDSEEECEKAVVALMKREQTDAAAKTAAAVPVTPPATASSPSSASTTSPTATPVSATATENPLAAPHSSAAVPATPAIESGAAAALPTPAVESSLSPPIPVPATSASEPAAVPATAAQKESAPTPEPAVAAPAEQIPAAEPAAPTAPAPAADPATAPVGPAAEPPVPSTTSALSGNSYFKRT